MCLPTLVLCALLGACGGRPTEPAPIPPSNEAAQETAFAIPLPTARPKAAVTPPGQTVAAEDCPEPPAELSFFEDPADYENELLCYLNALGSPEGLAEALESAQGTVQDEPATMVAQAESVDVTGDGAPDAIVYLRIELVGLFSREGLFVFARDRDSFRAAHRQVLGGQTRGELDGIRAVQDLTGDNLPEIVPSTIDNVGNSGAGRAFHVLAWNGATFVELVPPEGIESVTDLGGIADGFEIVNIDSDGLPEVRVTNFYTWVWDECGGGRVRDEYAIWKWDGTRLAFDRFEYPPPEYRFQAARDGDYATLTGQYDRALASYQQAIFDEALKAGSWGDWIDREPEYCPPLIADIDREERPRIEAYSRYRLVLVHVARGDLESARVVYDGLQDRFSRGEPGSAYAELAREFWDAYVGTQDIKLACQAAVQFATDNSEQVVSPLGVNTYGYFNSDYTPEDLCPFPPPSNI